VLYFVLEVVAASIVASLLASWIKLIPRYPKKRYFFIQQLANTALLTLVLTLLSLFRIALPWPLLVLVILAILWLSVRLTTSLAPRKEEPSVHAPEENAEQKEPESH